MKQLCNSVELLAPAGDWACLKAAVLNGADAVYFGLSDFNARRRATNFSSDELPKVVEYCHNHNVKAYVTFNTLVFSNELESAQKMLKAIAEAGCDAVIVQDLGITFLIKHLAPTLPVHVSTQMTLTDAAGVNLVSNLGIKRAILARELSIIELRQVRANTNVELEVFAHGALCISYSGQCLASLTLGGRSANRGLCAQPCRMPYQLVVNGKPVSHSGKKYVLSPTDLAAYAKLEELVDAGICGFKIEGRLKNEYYVAAAVSAYRAALDAAIKGEKFSLSSEQHARLVQGFSRGFTTGFLDGKDYQKLVHGKFPKSRGTYLGTVETKGRGAITIEFENIIQLKAGDGVVIDGAELETEQGGRIYKATAVGNNKMILSFGKDDIDFSKVNIGAAVWKTDDPAVRKQIEQTFNTDRVLHLVPIVLNVYAKLGEHFRISFTDDRCHTAQASWDTPLEEAQKYAITADVIREQFGRLGGTPFVLRDIHIEHLDNVMVPRSVLNDLRRKAVEELVAIRERDAKHIVAELGALENLRAKVKQEAAAASRSKIEIAVLVRTMEQFDAAIESNVPGMIYCDFIDTDLYSFVCAKAHKKNIQIGLATLRIHKASDEIILKNIIESKPDMVLIRNLAALAYFKNNAPQLNLIADFSLNISNELAASVLRDWGISLMTPSFDLNMEQLRALLKTASPAWFEQIIYDHIPMFHTEHCVAANMLSKGKDQCTCARPCKSSIEMEDIKSVRYQLSTDAACRNTIYHPTVFCAASHIEALKTMGLRRFRISLLSEDSTQTKTVISSFHSLLTGKADAGETSSAITKATRYKLTAAPLVR